MIPLPIPRRSWAWGVALLATAPLAAAQDEDRPARSGKEVYQQLCAVCHGVDGDGKGLVELDRPARSFKDGGFSFGNTQAAIARTVAAGIGGTPMPGFASALSDEELQAVAAYVIELGPEQPPEAGNASILTVDTRPRVVRGHLPAPAPGAPDHPRGLLVGTLDGLSWEYAADDLRLIAVRQGAFVDREDWRGRGGTPLKPLGRIVHLRADGRPGPAFVAQHPQQFGPAPGTGVGYRRALRATELRDGRARIESAVMAEGRPVATVDEWGEAFSLSTVAGYQRHFSVERHSDAQLRFLAGYGVEGGSEAESIPLDDAGFLCFLPAGDDAGTAYLIQTNKPLDLEADRLGVSFGIPEGTSAFSVAVFPLPAGAAEAWAQIQKEVMP